MAPRTIPTVLLRRRSIRLWGILSVVIGTAAVTLFLEVYPAVDGVVRVYIEIVAGLLIFGVIGNIGAYWVSTRRNTRLENELRRSRSSDELDTYGSSENLAPVLTSLGAAIYEYNSRLNRSRALKTERIQVQRQLLRVVLRATEGQLLILSGSGAVLYMSAAAAAVYEGENGSITPRLEPSGGAIAAHLLAGNGPGTVQVDGRAMYFTGIFGQIVSAGRQSNEVIVDPSLAYIVIAENAVSSGPTTMTSAPHRPPDTLQTRIRSFFSRV